MMRKPYALPLGLLALLTFPGCALTNKAQSNFARYFSPALPRAQSSETAQHSGVELRLGRISAGAHLREKIAYRSSSYEIGFYDDFLWTERPADYLRRALSQVLFEEQGLRSIYTGGAPVLDVELVSFEEIRSPQPAALVRITFVLRNERAVLLEQTLTVERPIPPGKHPTPPEAIAQALGDALRTAVYQVTERVLAGLPNPTTSAPVATANPPR